MNHFRMKFLNTFVDNVSMSEAVDIIDDMINDTGQHYVITPNVDHIVKLENDTEFQSVYKDADLILTDGMPLIWISKLMKKPIKEKVSGSDLFPQVCELADRKGYSMFLLGAAEGVAEIASCKLKEKFSQINIIGTYSPPYGFESKPEEINKIIRIISEYKPQILVVGLGAPKQEKFIHRYKKQLNASVSLALGASIDFEAGNIRRAPKWMQNIGLEWFYRFCMEPKRMFRRYFIDDLKIIRIYFKYKGETHE